MSLCCFPLFRGSRLKKAQSKKSFSCCRKWLKSRHQRLPPSGRIQTQDSKKDTLEELDDGFTYTVNPWERQEHQARNTGQCWSENSNEDIVEVVVQECHYTIYRVRVQVHHDNDTFPCWSQSFNEAITEELVDGFNYSTFLEKGKVLQTMDTSQCWTEGAAEFMPNLREACRLRALQECTLKKVAALMAPYFLDGNIPQVSSFQSIHPTFSRAQQILDDLLTRSCPPYICCDAIKVFSTCADVRLYNDNTLIPQVQIKRAIASMVGTWPDQVQGLRQPLHFPMFQLQQALVQVTFPPSQQLGQAHLLFINPDHPETKDATPEDPPSELESTAEPQEGPTQGLAPGPAGSPFFASPGLKQHRKPGWRRLFEPFLLLS